MIDEYAASALDTISALAPLAAQKPRKTHGAASALDTISALAVGLKLLLREDVEAASALDTISALAQKKQSAPAAQRKGCISARYHQRLSLRRGRRVADRSGAASALDTISALASAVRSQHHGGPPAASALDTISALAIDPDRHVDVARTLHQRSIPSAP